MAGQTHKDGSTINAFWFGPMLGPVHAACLRSFVRHGHKVVLHVYEEPEDLPEGIELFDANKLMQRGELRAHGETGSYAFASDLYRYRILAAGLGTYVDCDVYCLRPFPSTEYLMGWETSESINCAVLNAPAESMLVRGLVKKSSDPAFIPPWLPRRQRRILRFRKNILRRPVHPASMEWGTVGPLLLTHMVWELRMREHVLDIDAFYPIHWHQVPLLFRPDLSLSDLVTPASYGVHLFNSILKGKEPSEGSPLHQIIKS